LIIGLSVFIFVLVVLLGVIMLSAAFSGVVTALRFVRKLVRVLQHLNVKLVLFVRLCSSVKKVTQEVSQLVVDFLTVVALVYRHVFVEWVSRKMVKFAERVVAGYKPIYFEVWHEVELTCLPLRRLALGPKVLL
jgi:hypothetical protein